MATASKDGTFCVWNTDIRYQLGQEASLVTKGDYDELKNHPGLVALAPNGDTVLVSAGRQVRAFDAETGVQEFRVDDVHGLNLIVALKFSADSKYFLTAGDRQVHVFHNVVGYKVVARKTKQQVKSANTAAHKERLQQQADEAEAMVQKFASL